MHEFKSKPVECFLFSSDYYRAYHTHIQGTSGELGSIVVDCYPEIERYETGTYVLLGTEVALLFIS